MTDLLTPAKLRTHHVLKAVHGKFVAIFNFYLQSSYKYIDLLIVISWE
jgi:hypothetical protein